MMKHFKINVGRKKLSSEYIRSKQNFDSVLSGVKISQPSFWKSVWFYGTIGMAGVATVVGYKFYNSENHLNETIITQDLINPQDVVLNSDYLKETSMTYQVSQTAAVPTPQIQKIQSVVDEKEKQPAMTPHVTKTTSNEVWCDKKTEEFLLEEIPEPVITKAKKPIRNSMPSISGVYNGDISWEVFKDGVVFVGEDISVKQFSIQYTTRLGDKITSVKGDRIPAEVALELEKLGLNQTVFITNVVAGDERGSMVRFVSMDLNLKFK